MDSSRQLNQRISPLAGCKCRRTASWWLKSLDAESAGKLEQLIELMGDPDACDEETPPTGAV